MSIAVLCQVHDETRRLAIAGSNLAIGDFRLKKLIPPLEKAAGKAAVFGNVAQAIQKLVDSSEQNSAEALLELSTLVNAILYTQGRTGIEGGMAEIEASDMGFHTTQASARVLKPLIEALTTTGSGRQELIEEAHRRGGFQDLRLIQPALQALDDGYGEIADFVAEKVLPLYGKAILPELNEALDLKGRGGHVRRLRLIHRLDPDAARPLVEQALESGSKELKVAALTCMGQTQADLPYLLEQATAKNKEVRAAALQGLAHFKDDVAVDALLKALSGSDVELATGPASQNRSPKLLKFVLAEAEKQRDELMGTKDKAKLKKQLARFHGLLSFFESRSDKKTETFLRDCFDRRDEIVKLKGDISGQDINLKVATLLVETDSKPAQKAIVEARDTLGPDLLECAFVAAARIEQPKRVFDLFSPYLQAKTAPKQKRDAARKKHLAIREMIVRRSDRSRWPYGYYGQDLTSANLNDLFQKAELDPRWLDVAVQIGDMEMVIALARPRHKGANAFLSKTFQAMLNKKGGADHHRLSQLLETMIRIEHPEATDCLLEALKKLAASRYAYYLYWIARLIPQLPKKAAASIEELLPSLPERAIDELLPHVNELKAKK